VREFDLSRHAVERYNERVRPTLDLDQAGDELEQLRAECGEWSEEPPYWVNLPDDYQADGWLRLGDGIAFTVERNVVVTCLVRGGRSDIGRERRAKRRRARRARALTKDAGAVARWGRKRRKGTDVRAKRWRDGA